MKVFWFCLLLIVFTVFFIVSRPYTTDSFLFRCTEIRSELDQDKQLWFNYRTNTYDFIDTPVDFLQYIPQNPAAINMYKLLVNDMKWKPIDAALRVYDACTGSMTP